MSGTLPPTSGPYSRSVSYGKLVFVSGQIPVGPDGGVPESIVDQTRLALRNLESVLRASGSSMSKVLKVTVYMRDMSQFDAMNDEYAKAFEKPFPARTCIGASDLPKGVGIMVDAIAFTG